MSAIKTRTMRNAPEMEKPTNDVENSQSFSGKKRGRKSKKELEKGTIMSSSPIKKIRTEVVEEEEEEEIVSKINRICEARSSEFSGMPEEYTKFIRNNMPKSAVGKMQWLHVMCDSEQKEPDIQKVLNAMDEVKVRLNGSADQMVNSFIAMLKPLIYQNKVNDIKELLSAMEDVTDKFEQYKYCEYEKQIRNVIVEDVFNRFK